MKRLLVVIAVTIGLLDAGVVQAEPITMTYEEAGNAVVALLSMDGYQDVIGDKPVQRPYKLSSSVRLVIAKNTAKLRAVVQVYRDAHNAKQAELTDGTGILNDRTREALGLADAAILRKTESLDLDLIRIEDLALDTNPVPPSVLAGLRPLLVEAKP